MPDLKKIRNIGIMAHIDAGKTTTSERILYYTGKIHKIGEIDDGAATMDWMAQEQERGITIQSAATTTYWNDFQINLIDTPGHVDFTAEVERSLRVLDGAVAVLCAVGGVQPQTETVWHQADNYNVPRICFVNKMDRLGADFFAVLDDVKTKFSCETFPLQIPIGASNTFEGIIDLLRMQEIRFDAATDGEKLIYSEIAPERLDEAKMWREKMIDVLSAENDEIAELFLSEEEIPVEMLLAEIRKGTIERRFVPFLCGASRRNIGVQPLLDAITEFLPAPDEVAAAKAISCKKGDAVEVHYDDKTPCGLIFKIQYDKEMGILSYVRMYSGKIRAGEQVFNPGKKKKDRVNRILRMHANKSEAMDVIETGDIGVFIGLKFAQTGDTLCSEGNPILLENMSFPQPVISVAIESETLSDREKLNETLEILSKEDPTFTVREDSETGQVLISGMGELHIDVLTTRIKDEFKLPCRIGSPHVTYRESVSQEATHTERFEKVIGGKENVAELSIRILPQKQGEGNIFVNNADCRNVSEEVLTAIKNGIENSFAGGIKYGYPCTDIRVELTSVKFDEDTATPFAFEACAVAAFDAACEKAIPTVLEPIMNVDITCPKEFVGEAVSLVTMRGGMVLSMESKPTTELVHTRAPMVKMFGFSTSLRSVTQGRASFSMEFSHFELKPGGL